MKYMIMLCGSQRDYDALAGKPGAADAWSAEDVAALHEFMGRWNGALAESGELVDANGLDAPVHGRRVMIEGGAPVVTDGPYAETEEVLAGYTIVECQSFDRATEIAAELVDTPHPEGAVLTNPWHVDVRPIAESPPQPEL
jgi:hypothetical protein